MTRLLMAAACAAALAGGAAAEQSFYGEYIGAARDVVVPVSVQGRSGQVWTGTAVLVEAADTNGVRNRYLVTARHVVEGRRGTGADGNILTAFFTRRLTRAERERLAPAVHAVMIPLWSSGRDNNVGFPDEEGADVAAVFLYTVPARGPEPKGGPPGAGACARRKAARSDPAAAPGDLCDPAREDRALQPLAGAAVRNSFLSYPEVLSDLTDERRDSMVEVFYPGFPFGANGRRPAEPLIRSGVVASTNTAGYSENDVGPEAFLVDVAPLGGESGSPVFARHLVFDTDGRVRRAQVRLVGILAAGLDGRPEAGFRQGEASGDSPPAAAREAPAGSLGLGVAYRARLVGDAIRAVGARVAILNASLAPAGGS